MPTFGEMLAFFILGSRRDKMVIWGNNHFIVSLTRRLIKKFLYSDDIAILIKFKKNIDKFKFIYKIIFSNRNKRYYCGRIIFS